MPDARPTAALPDRPQPERRPARAPQPDADDVPQTAPSPDQPREDRSTPPEDDGFPSVEVEVVRADGTPAVEAQVYALNAGAPGRDGFADGPHATTDAHGRCRLPVLRQGTYDVGAVTGPLHALVCDVGIPSQSPVRIALPEEAEIVVVATPAVVERIAALQAAYGRADWVGVTLVGGDNAAAHAAPGRAELLLWKTGVQFQGGVREGRVVVPRGADVRVVVSDQFTATPETAHASATVHVDMSHGYGVALTAEFATAESQPAPAGWAIVEIDPGPGGSPRGNYLYLDVGAERARGMTRLRGVARFAVGGPSGNIRWRGKGIVEGSAEFEGFARDVDNLLDVTIRLDGTPLVAEPSGPPPRATRMRVADPAGRDDQVMCFMGHAGGGGMGSGHRPGDVATWRMADVAWVAAWRGREVAGPVRVGEPEAVNELTLGAGAHVTLSLDALPPRALGPVTIERADGVPLIYGGLVLRADLREVRAIGPLAPGEYDFVVRIAGEELRRVRAKVVAGDDAVVRIGRLSSP